MNMAALDSILEPERLSRMPILGRALRKDLAEGVVLNRPLAQLCLLRGLCLAVAWNCASWHATGSLRSE